MTNLRIAEPGMSTLSAPEAAAAVGISYRQLDFWISQGFVPGENPGSGRRRRFTSEDVGRLAMMARLVNAGMRVNRAGELCSELMVNGRIEVGPGMWIIEQ